MMRQILAAIFIFAGAIVASAQTDIRDCSQMLSKSLNEVESCRLANDTKAEQIRLQEKLILQLEALLKAKDDVIAAKDAELKVLRAIKCNETTVAFKPFGWAIIKRVKKECY